MGYEDGNYLAHTDFIQLRRLSKNGNGPVSFTTDTSGQIKILPPKTAEEIVARERERKARTTLLMAIPEDHLAKFHKMTDAKEMWNAIKSSLVEIDESKKMRINQVVSMDQRKLTRLMNIDLEGKMDLKWQVAFDLYEIEGSSTREDDRKTKEDNRRRDGWNPGNKDGSRTGKKEESKALVTVDGESVDWTTHSEDDENFAFMASNSSGSDTQVPSCSNECKESYANLKRLYDAQREQLSDASVENKGPYTQGLKKVEAQLVAHQQGQLWYEQKIKFMKIDLDDKTDVLTYHKKLLAKAQKEKDDLEVIVDKWNHSSKNLGKIVNYQMSASDKFGLGYGDYRYSGILSYENEVLQSVFKGNKMSEPVVNESNIEVQPKVWSDAPIIEEYESDSDDEYVSVQTKGLDTPSFANKQVKTPRENVKNQSTHSQKPKDNPHRTLKNKGIINSGCSRHMTGNKAYLADFQDFNGGPVAFGGSKGYITGKGKIKTVYHDSEGSGDFYTELIFLIVPKIHNPNKKQQFWNTLIYKAKTRAYSFQLDENRFTLYVNLLRESLAITPIDQAHQFVSPSPGDAIIEFVNELGYTEEIHFVSRMAAQISSSSDALGIITSTNVDYAELMNVPYYNACLEMVAKHDRKIAAEEGGKKKSASIVNQSKKPVTAKQSKPVSSKQSKPAPAKQPNPVKEKSTKHSPVKKAAKGKVRKVKKGKSSLQLVDEPDEEPLPSPEP
ncbi:hypothetical protein Tco_0367798 [Tanacetum coccineum]